MTVVEFGFERPEDSLTVMVRVYPTLDDLNEAVPCEERIGGVTQRSTRRRFVNDVPAYRHECIVNLCEERLGGGVIAHEAVHVAVGVHALPGAPLVLDDTNDEPFALTVGEVTRHINLGLRDHGLIDP